MPKPANDYIRQAIWKTYKRKCFYCDESLLFRNMHLDHIIPKRAFVGNEKSTIAKYGLKDSFDFNFIENLAPACSSCNSSRKRERELKHGVHIWIAQATEKVVSILAEVEELKNQLSLDLPDQYKEFFVTSPDFMHSRLSVEAIRKKDIPLYKELTFNSSHYTLLLTSTDNEDVVCIRNLTDYEYYTKKGFYPRTTPDISFASLYAACLEFFRILDNANTPKIVLNFRDYVMQLPAKMILQAGINPDPQEIPPEITSIKDLIDVTKDITVELLDAKLIIVITHKHLELRDEYETFVVKEIMQADFSGHGNIEVLFFIYYKSPGTFNYSYPCMAEFINGIWSIKEISKQTYQNDEGLNP